jgi:hypothetical protein
VAAEINRLTHLRRSASHHYNVGFQTEREQAEPMGQLAVYVPGDVIKVAADTGHEVLRDNTSEQR